MVAAIVFAITAPMVLVHAQQSDGILARPTQIDPNNLRTRSIFIHSVAAGESAEDQIIVFNNSSEDRQVELYSVDGTITNTGAYACMQNADVIQGSGAWVSLSKDKFTVPANGETTVDMTISVPQGASAGEYNSCIAISDGNEVNGAGEGDGIVVRMRQAIRVAIAVPGAMQRELSIESFLKNESSANGYDFLIRNVGNVSADVDIRAVMVDVFGREVASFGGEQVVVPGVDFLQQLEIDFRPMFGGWYEIQPSIRYDTRLGIFGTSQKNASYEQKTVASIGQFFWPTPAGWMVSLTVIGLVVMGGGWLQLQFMRHHSLRYVVRQKDTVQNLSKRLGRHWRTVARINSLKPPYELEKGQTIRLPIRRRQLKAKNQQNSGHA